MILQIPGGTFSDEPFHEYRDDRGVWIPSLTQILKLQGLTDYGAVNPEVLENAARRGTEVHKLAATYNRWGDIDPSWITEETRPYFESYLEFLADTGFKPDSQWTEAPFIACIHGFRVGITPDCFGKLGKHDAVLEFKCAAAEQPSWSIQTAMQECGIFQSNRCGRVRRFALMLQKKGKAKLREHTEHEDDMANGIAALRNLWWRIHAGQDVRRLLA